MKLTPRGFTLVELMIVIAIIGILAAALFPSLTNYLERGRDAARTGHLRDAANAQGAYYADYERYAIPTSAGCLSSGTLGASYLPSFPTDPLSSTRQDGCGLNGTYGLATGTGYANTPQFLLTAIFESDSAGNYNNATSTAVTILVGTGEFSFAERASLDSAGIVRKGNGSGYLIYK